MTDEHDFAILAIRQAALDGEADAARLVTELAAELGIEGAWERTEITNQSAEGTNEAIRFPSISQATLNTAIEKSSDVALIGRYFLIPA